MTNRNSDLWGRYFRRCAEQDRIDGLVRGVPVDASERTFVVNGRLETFAVERGEMFEVSSTTRSDRVRLSRVRLVQDERITDDVVYVPKPAPDLPLPVPGEQWDRACRVDANGLLSERRARGVASEFPYALGPWCGARSPEKVNDGIAWLCTRSAHDDDVHVAHVGSGSDDVRAVWRDPAPAKPAPVAEGPRLFGKGPKTPESEDFCAVFHDDGWDLRVYSAEVEGFRLFFGGEYEHAKDRAEAERALLRRSLEDDEVGVACRRFCEGLGVAFAHSAQLITWTNEYDRPELVAFKVLRRQP